MKLQSAIRIVLALVVSSAMGSVPAYSLELTVAHVNPPGEPTAEGFAFLEKEIAKSKTGLTVKIFPRGQVGDEKDAIEQVKIGAITMTGISSANLVSFAPSVGVVDIPFLFRDEETHPWIVADGPIGKKLAEQVQKESGLVVLGWWTAGMRHVFTRSKPINSPADIKDLKIRVIGSPVYLDTFNGMGAKATPMPYGEVYTSLATGIIDAAENDTSGYRGMRFYEPASYLAMTGHFFLYKVVVANKAALDKMSPAQRTEFNEMFAKATAYMRNYRLSVAKEDLDWVIKNGKVKVTYPDRAAFEAILKPVQEKYSQKYGRELVDSIRNAK